MLKFANVSKYFLASLWNKISQPYTEVTELVFHFRLLRVERDVETLQFRVLQSHVLPSSALAPPGAGGGQPRFLFSSWC